MRISKHIVAFGAVVAMLVISNVAVAQDTSRSSVFGLSECIQYALENNLDIKNSMLDADQAEMKVKETISKGLPQVNGKWDLMFNPALQPQFIPNEGPFSDPTNPSETLPLVFGTDWTSNMSATLNQLIFDGSYFVGLKAAKTYKELYAKGVSQTEIEVIANVKKAFYGVLIANERLIQLDRNLGQLDKLMNDTKVMYDNGFVEKVDMQRIEVNINNLKVERQKIVSLGVISESLLKYQMGMPLKEKISLNGSLDELINSLKAEEATVNYNDRVEYQNLVVQQTLGELNLKNEKISILPSLGVFATGGLTYGALTFSNAVSFGDYKGYAMLGGSLSVPIWSSGIRKHRIDQAKVDLDKVLNSKLQLQNSIDLQVIQSKLGYEDNLATLETHEKNVALAEEVYRVSKVKYEQGVGSNFEVVESENLVKDTQSNYYGAVYDALVSKVDLDKAKGVLTAE